MIDQKLVMSHVYGHVDFFKNNFTFQSTNQGIDPRTGAARSASGSTRWPTTARSCGAGRTASASTRSKSSSTTACSLENLIDLASRSLRDDKPRSERAKDPDDEPTPGAEECRACASMDYMESYINPDEFLEKQRKKMADEKAKERKKSPSSPSAT